jgi:hypothetical protein
MYDVTPDEALLIRTGTHADLFEQFRYAPTPFPFSALPISSRIAGSSMVAGIDH